MGKDCSDHQVKDGLMINVNDYQLKSGQDIPLHGLWCYFIWKKIAMLLEIING